MDPDQVFSQNSEALEAQNKAVEGLRRSQKRTGASQWSPGGSIDQRSLISITLMRSRIRIRIRIEVKSWIRIRIKIISWIRFSIKVMWNRTLVWCRWSQKTNCSLGLQKSCKCFSSSAEVASAYEASADVTSAEVTSA